jgi:hypothetical protein
MSFIEQTPIVTYCNHVNNADCSLGSTNTKHGLSDHHTDSNINANELINAPQVVYVANDSV